MTTCSFGSHFNYYQPIIHIQFKQRFPGNPDNGEDCGYLKSSWEWADYNCDIDETYLCEYLSSKEELDTEGVVGHDSQSLGALG